MYVATLIAKPGHLAASVVEALRADLRGRPVSWLSDAEAAEFETDTSPNIGAGMRNDLDSAGVDLVVQPRTGRRKRMLLADMDSTMIEQECIDELAAEAGVGDQVADITARAMNGELDFEAAIDARVALLKGLPAKIIDHVIETRITYMPGGRALVGTMAANGAFTALVSGGFTAFTSRVAEHLGFDVNLANRLKTADDVLTGYVVRPILGQQAKLDALHHFTTQQGIAPSDVIAVGDGMNDLLMLQNAGTGVALHGKPALQEKCDICINHGDLTALLYLQGYTASEFVTESTARM